MYVLNEQGRLIESDAVKDILTKVQKDGNKVIHYQTDEKTYGVIEKWAYPKEVGTKLVGDCEDYSLWKLERLVEAGVPRSCLLMTICIVDGSGHCVLSVITDKRDFILCNNHEGLTTPQKMRSEGYKFLYRQQLGKAINEPWDKLTR